MGMGCLKYFRPPSPILQKYFTIWGWGSLNILDPTPTFKIFYPMGVSKYFRPPPLHLKNILQYGGEGL